jgi:hypothetical protein
MLQKFIFILLGFTLIGNAIEIGHIPPHIILKKTNGGTTDGKAWDSKSLKGKVHTLLYMDPDKRSDSQILLDALAKLNIDNHKYSTVAIINLAATWLPNSILQSKLKEKQKELKNMEYVFDKTKFLVKKWKLKDDASNVLILDKDSKVIYQKNGKLQPYDIKNILDIINKEVQK